MNIVNEIPSLTGNMIARGGRPAFKKQCATDEGYGHANRELVRKVIEEARNDIDYDPRFDYRSDQELIAAGNLWELEQRRKMDAWRNRNKFA